MKFYVFKSKENSLFKPEGLVFEPFLFPKSTKLLPENDRPFIYIFEQQPSQNIISEYNLEKSVELDEYNSLDELKNDLRKIDLWRVIALL